MEQIANKKLIFNPNGNDDLSERTIIKGNSTGIFNLSESKYKWATSLYRKIISQFWIPERISLIEDRKDYLLLDEHEKDIFVSILSFLTFLDSIQTNNIPKVADYITASEVSTVLSAQAFYEVIHSQSYSYIIDSVIPVEDRKQVYEKWRTNEVLFERNKYIAEIYQKFWDSPSDESLAMVIIANYILESIYFYNGFIFFYNLASRGLMPNVASEIKLINRDEVDHIAIFSNIINTIKKEFPTFFNDEIIKNMFSFACYEEIKWFNHILKNSNIIGLNQKSTESYTKYLVNERLERIGIEPLYKGFTHNPYASLELHSDSESQGTKTNFFEKKQTNYSGHESLGDWDF